jgi:hypothetical protein
VAGRAGGKRLASAANDVWPTLARHYSPVADPGRLTLHASYGSNRFLQYPPHLEIVSKGTAVVDYLVVNRSRISPGRLL